MKQIIVEIDDDHYMARGENLVDDISKALINLSIPAVVYDLNDTVFNEMLDMLRETYTRLTEMKSELRNIDSEHIDNILLGTSEVIAKATGTKRD